RVMSTKCASSSIVVPAGVGTPASAARLVAHRTERSKASVPEEPSMTRASRRAAAVLREAMAVLILTGATGLVVTARRAEQEARAQATLAEAIAFRAITHDRLVGSQLDLSVVPSTGHQGASRTVLWILDLGRCADCLHGLADWTKLSVLEDHDLHLLLVGE